MQKYHEEILKMSRTIPLLTLAWVVQDSIMQLGPSLCLLEIRNDYR
jgi:hypothetical protein